jgi:hypothetical protein
VAKSTPKTGENADLYALYDELDRLEELLEDMSELGVTTAAEVERRIEELNERIDAAEAAEDANR